MKALRLGGHVLLLALTALGLAAPALGQSPCAAAPRTDCRRSERGQLLIKNDGSLSTRRLVWRWRNGEATQLADFGDPLSTAQFGVCLYQGPDHARILDLSVPAGAPRWRRNHSRGYRYRDASDAAGGVKAIGLGSGAAGKANITVVGRDLPQLTATAPFALPVTIQLVSAASGVCWESVYAADNRPDNGPVALRAHHSGIPRPNVILINTDDQREVTASFMPSVMAQIAARGVTFENAFSSNPVCLPSRASILTGNYSHTHGVLSNGVPNGGPLRFIGPDRQTIAVWLQAEGYRTGFFGKYHGYGVLCGASGCPVPPGWDEWHAFVNDDYFDYEMSENGAVAAYGAAPEDYSTDVLRDKVLAFLDAHRDEPFFVHLTPFAPHGSTSRSFLPVPAPRHAEATFVPLLWRPVSYLEADVSDKPSFVQTLPAVLDFTRAVFNDLTWILGVRSLFAVDEAIGAIIAKLEEQGRLTDTVILFTSDHGFSNGEHRWFGKLCPYEECIRVPLMVRYPRVLRDRAQSRAEAAMLIDLAPTIAEWADVSPGRVPPLDGRSLAAVAEGRESVWRDAVLLEQWQSRRFSGVRTAQWKYVRHGSGERELYDLANDPVELTNVAGQFPALADELEGRILELGGSLP